MAASVVSSAKNSADVAGGTGVTVTHGLTLANSDVLVAFVGVAEADQTAIAASGWTVVVGDQGGGTTTYLEAIAGNDRAQAALYKVISDAGSEPSTYTFTRTGDATTRGQAVIIVQCRGIDTGTPFDVSGVTADAQDDQTPTAPAITTVTAGALVLTGQTSVMSGTTGDLTALTPGAPSGMTLVNDVRTAFGDSSTDMLLVVASLVTGGAGTQTLGQWTHSGGDDTNDNIVTTVALRPSEAAATNTTNNVRSLRNLTSLVRP